MKRGPKPVPMELRELHGNPRKVALPNDAPEGEGVLSEAPEWMDDEQRLQWDYALEHAPHGLLTGTDREILAIWCVAAVEYARAVAEVRKLGQVVKTRDGNAIQNPFLAIVNRQAFIMMRAGAEMGFSPAARMSIALSGEQRAGDGARYIGAGLAKPSRLDQYLDAKPDCLTPTDGIASDGSRILVKPKRRSTCFYDQVSSKSGSRWRSFSGSRSPSKVMPR